MKNKNRKKNNLSVYKKNNDSLTLLHLLQLTLSFIKESRVNKRILSELKTFLA